MNLEPIDTSTTAGKAEVMRLADEGRKVAKKAGNDRGWIDCPDPVWNWPNVDYAIIVEEFAIPTAPDELWVIQHKEGDQSLACDESYARSWVEKNGGELVRYVRADQ